MSTYTYDMAGQLTDITHANSGTVLARSAYTLDILGNRTSTSVVGGVPSPRVTSYTANALNQYTQVAGVAFAYDANGNLIHDGKQTYRYDAQNRLLGVEPVAPTTGAIRAEFAYDARNRAVARTYYTLSKAGAWVLNPDDSRALTYDTAWNLLAERTRNGTQVGEYIHGQRTDEILVSNLKSQIIYPLADGLGSVVALASDNGKVTERFRYSAFGHPMSLSATYQAGASSVSGYRFLFTGREWLSAIGLNEHRNRYYSASLGRWLTADPIHFQGGLNLHVYAINNPYNEIDPSGLDPSLIDQLRGGAKSVGAAGLLSLGSAQLEALMSQCNGGTCTKRNNCMNCCDSLAAARAVLELGEYAVTSASGAVWGGWGALLTTAYGTYDFILGAYNLRNDRDGCYSSCSSLPQ